MVAMTEDRVSIQKIQKDLMQAVSTKMGATEARKLVDLYYQMQDFRIQASAQKGQLAKQDEPIEMVEWLWDQLKVVEAEIQKSLGYYADSRPAGQWARSIYGIGPVLAAGLMAHIDIERCPTVGHIWRFAGLDPTVKWLGKAGAATLVGQIDDILEADDEANTLTDDEIEQLMAALPDHADVGLTYPMLAMASRLTGRGVGNLARLARNKSGKVTRDSLLALLSRRPWNADLKVLTWKIGQSFMKFSGQDKCFYGHLYQERKAQEVQRNLSGANAEAAARILIEKNFRGDTVARAAYMAGILPDGHVDARARRWTVKLFLSHYHYRAYEAHLGEPLRTSLRHPAATRCAGAGRGRDAQAQAPHQIAKKIESAKAHE
jgi:hypothetical protein